MEAPDGTRGARPGGELTGGEVQMENHRAEAEKTLQGVIEALASPEPVSGLRRYQLRGALEYALEQVRAIQELKRQRSTKGEVLDP